MRAAIYARVSSEMQVDGYSLDEQLAICRRYAAERGWTVVAEYIERGVSARSMERPQFKEMMAAVKDGLFDVIIVHKLDRFSRSVIDILLAVQTLSEWKVALASVYENFDFTTPVGRVTFTMMAVIAQWYVDNLRDETIKGKRGRAKAGLWNGAVPFGYRVRYKKDGGDGRAEVDKNEARGVQMAFQMCADGVSDAAIARALTEAGFHPHGRGKRALQRFSKDTVRAMLRNRFYLGYVRYRGEWFPGIHEAIIDEELFRRCAAARKARRKRVEAQTQKRRVYLLSGGRLLRCGRCGEPMRGQFIRGRRYYRCTSHQHGVECDLPLIPADDVEEMVAELLSSLQFPDDWREKVLRQLVQGDVTLIERERRNLEDRLSRMRMLFMLGDISKDVYLAERRRIKSEIAALVPPKMFDLEEAQQIVAGFRSIWEVATPQERKDLIRALLREVIVDKREGRISIVAHPRMELESLFFDIARTAPKGCSVAYSGSDGIRTRDLRLDRPAC